MAEVIRLGKKRLSHTNTSQKVAGVVLVSDKVDFGAKSIIRDKIIA